MYTPAADGRELKLCTDLKNKKKCVDNVKRTHWVKREASVRRRGSRRARNLYEEGGVRVVNEGDHGSHVQKHIQSKAVDSVSPGTKEKKKNRRN